MHASLAPLGSNIQCQVSEDLWRSRPALLAAVAGFDALVVRNQTLVDAELIDRAERLRVVGRLGAGLDNLDLAALTARGVTVVHGAGLNARAVAEYVIAAILNLSRHLSRSDSDIRRGTWVRRPGFEMAGVVLGIVGLGQTGRETARLARALGMTTLASDPFVREPASDVVLVSMEDLLQRAMVLSVHVPLSSDTVGLIGEAELALLPTDAIVVNASRGGVIDEGALYRALKTGRLGGAALDVRKVEPPPADDSFLTLDNVLLTAHLAGLTVESQRAIAASVLADVRRVLEGTSPQGPAILPQS